jgi:hypothetical protein
VIQAQKQTRVLRQGAIPRIPRTLRIPFVRRCTLVGAASEMEGMVLDLSLNGAYVRSGPSPRDGESLEVCFRVPGNDREIRIRSLVAWINLQQSHPVHSLPPGFGLSFLDTAPADARLIAETIHAYCNSNPIYRQYL